MAYIVEELGNDRTLLMRLVSKDAMRAIDAVYSLVRPRMIGPSKWERRARAISVSRSHRMFTNEGSASGVAGRARKLITSQCAHPVMYEIMCEGSTAHFPALAASFGDGDRVDLCISRAFWECREPNGLLDLVALKSRIARLDVHDCAIDEIQFDALLRILPKTLEYLRLEDIACYKTRYKQSSRIAAALRNMVGLVYLDLCFTLGGALRNKRGQRAFRVIGPALSTLGELQWLNLSGTTIDPVDLTDVLASTRKLRILIVARCLRAFTPGLARALLSSPMLERLSLAQCCVRLDMLDDAARDVGTDSRLAQIDLFGTYVFQCDMPYATLARLLAKLKLRRLLLLYTFPNTQELVSAVAGLSLAEPLEYILSVPRDGHLSCAECRDALPLSATTKFTWVEDPL
jgi:hypothetical protein